MLMKSLVKGLCSSEKIILSDSDNVVFGFTLLLYDIKMRVGYKWFYQLELMGKRQMRRRSARTDDGDFGADLQRNTSAMYRKRTCW